LSVRDGGKRERILAAAVKVFARKGFHNSRIAEVAEEAGVASGTIYLYFRNKDDILISVFEDSLEDIIKGMETQLADLDDPRDKLRKFIERHLAMLEEHKELAEVLQVELRQSHKFMKEYEPTRWIDYLNIIAGILKQGQESGAFRKDVSLGVFKRAVFGALDEISLYWVLTEHNDGDYLAQAAEQLSSLLLDGTRESGKRKSAKTRRTA